MKNNVSVGTGITDENRQKIATQLSKFLADSYTLYLKTHNFHWNVRGPLFQTLHLMFEGHYNELALAVDTIAERIRALGYPAPGTYREFSQLTSIKEPTTLPVAKEMVRQLMEDHETMAKIARSSLTAIENAHDDVTEDLFTTRMNIHEKTAWMLRSLLEE